ncbi:MULTISPECIES: hypothetical protein [unclassified Burkholderia]|uniref:hypothetical protein n=1 Tax=unclassified Burkholderia TaxID=2613784 RepID=UPI000AD9460B|nr:MULTISPECIES: hypothetical protein [unclassified Burkholderia]
MSFQNFPVVMAGLVGLVVFQSGISHTAVGQGVSGFIVNAVLLALAARLLK